LNKTYITLGIIGVILIIVFMVFSSWISYSNKEIDLRTSIEAKQVDNKNEFDNMWKQISQIAQVADKDRESLMSVFTDYANARTGEGDQGSLMKWVVEAVPNIAPMTDTYKTLMNTITATRNRWTMRQKELIDMAREHKKLLMQFPGNIFLMGRMPIEIKIVTSSKTEKSFETGTDDDVSVFGK
jgi:hypothetical protein